MTTSIGSKYGTPERSRSPLPPSPRTPFGLRPINEQSFSVETETANRAAIIRSKNKVSRDSEMRQRFLNNRLKNGSDSEEQLVFEVRVFTRSEQECVRACACVCECAGQAEFPKNRVVMTLSLGNNKMRVFLETSRVLLLHLRPEKLSVVRVF